MTERSDVVASLTHRFPEPSTRDRMISGALEWLARETEADAVALLQGAGSPSPSLVTAPQGLSGALVLSLLQNASDAIAAPEAAERPALATVEWLGPNGISVLVTHGASAATPGALQFARSILGWLASVAWESQADSGVEREVRSIPGVVWAEAASGRLRVLTVRAGEPAATRQQVMAAAGRYDLAVEWLGQPGEESTVAPLAERPRLLGVDVPETGADRVTARVRLSLGGRDLVGTATGDPTFMGRHVAAARATLAALKPIWPEEPLIGDCFVIHSVLEAELVVVSLVVRDLQVAGAALVRAESPESGAARATLDALNRILARGQA